MSESQLTYRENLVPRIRKLIKGYTVSSILKEYLQNADDAGATELKISFDHNSHKRLHGTRFEKASGPALLIENNSFFKEKDFESIVQISKEGKVDDPTSTGRFGEGFSCSFSISDDPSFVSSGKAFWFDVLYHSVSKDKSHNITVWDDLLDKDIEDWLKTFHVDGDPNFDMHKTIFRLPLRTKSSDISAEQFTYQDFIDWVNDWTSSPHKILFLRNVQKLTLEEITTDGERICLAEIKSGNETEVRKIKASIQSNLGKFDSSRKLPEYWLSKNEELPHYCYMHELVITKGNKKLSESWAVVNGLFEGPNKTLIHHSLEALSLQPVSQKVLPWCGCAVRLNDIREGVFNEGKFYTFLPLEIKSPFPVHIHGWFDLDDKRTQITQQGGGSTSEILIRWNRALLTHGIGHAYAKLLDFVKDELPIAQYYKLWPQKVDDPIHQCVTNGFYTYVCSIPSIRTMYNGEESWKKPNKSIFYIPQRNKSDLERAVASSFRVAIGGITAGAISQLKKTDAKLTELKPSHLLNHIANHIDESSLPRSLGDIELSLLSDIEKYINILSFCVGKDKDFSVIEGVPLTLTSDEKLHASSVKVIISPSQEYKRALDNKGHVMLHPRCNNLIESASFLPSAWLKSSLINLLTLVSENFEEFERTDEWIELLISIIWAESEKEVNLCVPLLSRMPIVETEKNDWVPVSTKLENYCPVILPDRFNSSVRILDRLNLNIIKTSKRDLYRKLNNHKQLLLELSPLVLAKHIIKNKEVDFCSDEKVRLKVLEYLSSDIGWVDHLTPSDLNFFLSIPFVKIESGSLVPLDSDRKIFLSSGFKPPEHISGLQGAYDLVADNSVTICKLFKKLNVKEQTARHYITEVILPFIKNTSQQSEREKAICWLVSEWESIKSGITEDDFQHLRLKLSQTELVPISIDSTLVRPQDVYTPSFAKELPALFRDSAYIPAELPDLEESWESFLTDLGANLSVISKHVIHVAYNFAEEENIGKGIEFWNYIIEKYKDIKGVMFGNKTLLESLSDLPIMPVSNSGKPLRPKGIIPKFGRAKNLIMGTNHNLLGGTYNTVHGSVKLSEKSDEEKEFIKQLGLVTQVRWHDVMESFSRVRLLETTGKAKEEREIQGYAISFYRYVGRDKNANQLIPEKVRTNSIRINNMWVDGSDVFQDEVKVGGIFTWSSLIADGSDLLVKKGLERLGVTQRPTPAYMARHLSDAKKYPINTTLDDTSLFEIRLLLGWFRTQSTYDILDWPEFPLLGTDDRLHHPDELYTYTSTSDIEAFEHAYDKSNNINFVARDFVTLARELDLKDIRKDSHCEINKGKSVLINDGLDTELLELEKYLQSENFKDGLIRLVADKHGLDHSEVISLKEKQLLPTEFIYCESLFLDYFIEHKWLYTDNTATSFLDEECSSLYLLANADLEDMVDEVIVFVAENHRLDGKHQQSLTRILRKKMKPNEIAGLLDKKNMVSLPEDFDVYEDVDIFESDSPDESFEWDSQNNVMADFEIDSAEIEASDDIDEIESWGASEADLEEAPEYTHNNPIKTNGSKNSERYTETPRRISGTLSLPNSKSHKQDKAKTVSNYSNERSDIPPPTAPKFGSISSIDSGERGRQPGKSKGNQKDKESSSSLIKNSNSRYPVYIYDSSHQEETDELLDSNDRASVIGSKGEDYLIENQSRYTTISSHSLIKAKTNQEGYDITEVSEDGEVIRYIEVKTCEGEWGSRGVTLTLPQFEFAKQHDNWCLFVVENIEAKPLHPKVYELPNPVLHVNRFIFDSTWKQTAASPIAPLVNVLGTVPKPGDVYYVPSLNEEIKIIAVQPRGKLTKIEGKIVSNGFNTKMKFDTSWKLR